jgi:hypothetical protein
MAFGLSFPSWPQSLLQSEHCSLKCMSVLKQAVFFVMNCLGVLAVHPLALEILFYLQV